ncbi:YihY/virulence factor BrkB family protein [Geobacter chapellei]|uniref:YihY/virulence factor BrkB family protein n=1 Tax=Pelotalea chapellei TaxID=44671 RepID=A0ABS5U9L4_9BACT|nr:YihY/virulence factor BrkB family protein [Pelotalea chapellei]
MFSIRSYFKLGRISYLTLAKKVYHEVVNDGCAEYAAAMAYYLLLALFPFFLFLTTLLAYLPLPDFLESILTTIKRVLPNEVFALLQDNIRKLFSDKKGGLLSLGFLLAMWTSSNAVTAIMEVMNRLYEVKEGRPFWKVRLIAISLVILISVLFIISLVLLMFGPKIGDYIANLAQLGNVFQVSWDVLLVPVILFLLILALAVIYYLTPDVKQDWKWISPGAVFAIPSWVLASLAFSYYINNFGSYDKTYGSIGAVIILLLWLYISGFIILIGAEINAVIEHESQEGKDPGEKVENESEHRQDRSGGTPDASI